MLALVAANHIVQCQRLVVACTASATKLFHAFLDDFIERRPSFAQIGPGIKLGGVFAQNLPHGTGDCKACIGVYVDFAYAVLDPVLNRFDRYPVALLDASTKAINALDKVGGY